MNYEDDILIVDDEIPNLRLLSELLEKEGYQVRSAAKPQTAIDLAMAKPPALFLLDVRMPEMDGFELCRRLKQDERTNNIPVIFVGAIQEIDDKVHGFEAGGVDYISKPYQNKEVLARVRTVMSFHQMQQHLEQLVDERTSELSARETDLRKKLIELEDSEEWFRVTFEQAAVGIAHVSLEGHFLRINRKFCEIAGYTRDEMLRRTFQDITHPDDLDADLNHVQRLLAGEADTYTMEKRYFRKDGATVWVNLTVSLLRDPDGKPKRFVSVVEDISERKQVEDALRTSEGRFRSLMEASPLAIEILAPDGHIIQVNAAWMRLWGTNEEETARAMADYNMLNDGQLVDLGIAPLVKRAFSGQHVVLPPIQYHADRAAEEIGFELEQGRSPWIQSHLYAVKDENEEVSYVVNIYMDITELRQAEQEALKQREALARVDRATTMGQLTGSISHELNQPLTGILSNAQAAELMIQSGQWEDGEMAEIMAEIVSDAKRAGDVIRNLRQLYRQQKVEFLPVDINEIVEETIQLLHSEFIIQRVVLTTEYASALPWVNGNKVQIQQVLVNLIMNGTQAMSGKARDDRRIHIVTVYDGDEIKAWVEDNGSGIDPARLHRIFEPLATWKPGHTGMGLAISNSIITAHGGRMWAENRSEGGARVGFALLVPRKEDVS